MSVEPDLELKALGHFTGSENCPYCGSWIPKEAFEVHRKLCKKLHRKQIVTRP